MTSDQLVGKVERLRRELDLLYRSEAGWDTAALDPVVNELTEAEFALTKAKARYLEGIGAD